MLWGILIGVVVTLPIMTLLLRRQTDRARSADREARDAARLAELGSLTSGLAHELKNPLSTVGLNAGLLAEDIDDLEITAEAKSAMRRRLQTLTRETNRLKHILEDFLQFAGRVQLSREPTDVGQLVDELGDFFHPQADQAGVIFRTEYPQPGTAMANIDGETIKQAVLNLLLNAVQAMAEHSDGTGQQELILKVQRQGEDVCIHVIDTGPGLERDLQEEIFHPYVSTRKGGTGLGLPTSRRLVEEHGGQILVDSEVGRGSDFQIQLPGLLDDRG